MAEDPSDPLSHAALATALAQLGYEQRAADEAKRAIDFSSTLSRQRRLEVEAQYYTMRRDWQRAAGTYKALWTDFPDDLDYGIGAATAHSKGGNVPAARQTIAQLRRNPAAAQDPRVDLAEALAAETAGEPRQELELARSAFSKATVASATQAQAESLYYEGWARWLLGDLKGAEAAYAQALSAFAEAGNQRRVVDVKSGIASVLLDEGKTMESARLLEEGLAIARKLGERSLEGTVNNNLGRCWEELGQLKKAQLAYEQTAVIDRELNDRQNLAIALLNVGGVLKDQGNFELGRLRTTEALDVARAVGRKTTIALALSNLGDESQVLGHLSEAFQLQTEALAVAREIGRKTAIASALSGQGAVLRSQGKWQDAERKYDEASRVAADAGAPVKLAEIKLDEAQLLADEGRLEIAAKLGRQALQQSQHENSGERQALAEAILAQIAGREGDGKRAQPLAVSARNHMASGEVLITRIEVTKAGAFAALSMGRRAEALHILHALLAEARNEGLRETVWELELLITEIDSTANGRSRVLQIKREAASVGMLRITNLAPRLAAVL